MADKVYIESCNLSILLHDWKAHLIEWVCTRQMRQNGWKDWQDEAKLGRILVAFKSETKEEDNDIPICFYICPTDGFKLYRSYIFCVSFIQCDQILKWKSSPNVTKSYPISSKAISLHKMIFFKIIPKVSNLFGFFLSQFVVKKF